MRQRKVIRTDWFVEKFLLSSQVNYRTPSRDKKTRKFLRKESEKSFRREKSKFGDNERTCLTKTFHFARIIEKRSNDWDLRAISVWNRDKHYEGFTCDWSKYHRGDKLCLGFLDFNHKIPVFNEITFYWALFALKFLLVDSPTWHLFGANTSPLPSKALSANFVFHFPGKIFLFFL